MLRCQNGSYGPGRELRRYEFIAVKPPLEFCYPEAAIG